MATVSVPELLKRGSMLLFLGEQSVNKGFVQEMEITVVGDRIRILMAIRHLKASCSDSTKPDTNDSAPPLISPMTPGNRVVKHIIRAQAKMQKQHQLQLSHSGPLNIQAILISLRLQRHYLDLIKADKGHNDLTIH